MSYNQITTIPSELSQINNLQELYLYNNQITTIPSELSQLNNLQKLYLYNNQIKYSQLTPDIKVMINNNVIMINKN